MKIKIFDKKRTRFDVIEEKGGFDNMINDFCGTVNVIDIVVLGIDEIVVKYENQDLEISNKNVSDVLEVLN